MTTKLGVDTPSKFYLGADAVAKMYLGADVVYSASGGMSASLIESIQGTNNNISFASRLPSSRVTHLVAVHVQRSGSVFPVAPSVSGGGINWTLAGSHTDYRSAGAVTRASIYLFKGQVITPSEGIVTVTNSASNTGITAQWVEVSGVAMADDAGVVQTASSASQSTSTTPSATLAAFGAADNETVGFLAHFNGAVASTAGTGFTKHGEVVNGNNVLAVESKNVADTSVDFNLASNANYATVLAAEIRKAESSIFQPVGQGVGTNQSSPVVSTLYNVAWPAGYFPVPGDFALMLLAGHNSTFTSPTNITVPGFTKVPSAEIINGSWEFTQPWYKKLDGSEAISQFGITSGAVTAINAVMLIFRGVDGTSPFDAAAVTASASGTTHTPASITTVTNEALVVPMIQRGAGSAGLFNTLWATIASSILGARWLGAASRGKRTPGVMAVPAVTGSSTTWISTTMALKPGTAYSGGSHLPAVAGVSTSVTTNGNPTFVLPQSASPAVGDLMVIVWACDETLSGTGWTAGPVQGTLQTYWKRIGVGETATNPTLTKSAGANYGNGALYVIKNAVASGNPIGQFAYSGGETVGWNSGRQNFPGLTTTVANSLILMVSGRRGGTADTLQYTTPPAYAAGLTVPYSLGAEGWATGPGRRSGFSTRKATAGAFSTSQYPGGASNLSDSSAFNLITLSILPV